MADVSELKGKVGIEGIPGTVAGLKAVGEGMQKLGTEAKGAAGHLAQTQTTWGRFKSDFASGFNFSAGLTAFNVLKNGLTSFGSTALDVAADYEQTMNILEASSGASASQMAALGDRARELGGDLTLPGTSASDAAAAMLELNKAGLDINETLAASKGVLQLSAAAQIDNATAATITAGALNTFNLEGSEAARVADMLAGGANASSASITDLSQGFQQAGFAFSATNQSADDLITAIAALTNVGLTGSDSGTALKSAMLMLAAPTDVAADKMDELGINVRDASGQMLPFPELIGHLQDKLEDLSPAQRDMALKTMVQSDGMKALLPLLALGTDGFAELKTKVNEQGAAAKMAAAQNQGFNGAVDGLKSSVETLANNAITPLLPLLTSMTQKGAAFVGWLAENAGPAVDGFVNGLRLLKDGADVAFGWFRDNGPAILMTIEIGLGTAAAAMTAFGIATGAAAVSSAAAGLSIGSLATSVSGLAGKVALAAGPWVVLAAAIYGAWEIAQKYQAVQEQIHDGIDAMLSGKTWWNDASASLERFREVQGGASETTKQTAAELEALQTQLRDLTIAHTQLAKDSDLSAEAEVNFARKETELKAAIEEKTRAVNLGTAADRDANREIGNSLQGLSNLREGYGDSAAAALVLSEKTGLVGEALDEVNRKIDEVNSKSVDIFGGMESDYKGHTESMARLQEEYNQATDQKTKDGLQDQMNAQIVAYAKQELIQRESIGRQLIELAKLEGEKNHLSREAIGAMTAGIAQEYGVAESVVADATTGMAASITGWAESGGKNTAAVVAGLTETSDAALETQRAVSEMTGTYQMRLETNLDKDIIDVETYNALMREVPTKHTLELFQNFLDGKLGAEDFITAVNKVPPAVTTTLNVDATSGKAAAYAAGADFASGMAAGITANMYMVTNASQKTAASAAAATRNYLKIESPSKVMFEAGAFTTEGFVLGIESKSTLPGLAMSRSAAGVVDAQNKTIPAMTEAGRQSNQALAIGIAGSMQVVRGAAFTTGWNISQATADGIESTETVPRDALKKAVGDVASAYRSFATKQEELNRAHAAKLAEIWDDYYAELKEQTEQFNGDKFDSQMGFFEDIADMDAASRQRALEEQKTAWDTAQQMAQEGRAAEAQAYYDASLAEIEADQQRADKITGIAEDIADKKKELAEAGSEEQRAAIAAEIAELESRKAYLEQLDAQQDALAAGRLEELKNADSAIAEERDQAIDEEYSAYHEAQQKLGEDFGQAVDGILGHEDRMLTAHVDFANALISSYQGAADAARQAMASLPTSASSTGGGESGEVPVDGSHALGLPRVPFDNYIARLHKDEAVLTPPENAEWMDFKHRQREAAASVEPSRSSRTTGAGGDSYAINFNEPVYIQNDMDIEEVARRVVKRIRQAKGGN